MSSADPNPMDVLAPHESGAAAENPWVSPAGIEAEETAERESREEVKRDVKRGILALFDQAVCSGTNFLTIALLARSLSMATFGVFSLAFLCFQFARTIQERTLAAPYLVFTHRPAVDSRKLLGSNLVHQAFFAVVVLIVTVVAGVSFSAVGKPVGLGNAFLALALAIPFLLLRDQLRAVCLAHFRMDVALALNVAVAVLQIGGLGLLLLLDSVSVLSAATVMGIACLAPAAAWYAIRPMPFTVERSQLLPDWKRFWGFSRWLVLARAIGIGGQYLVPAMVAIYLDPAQVGAFATCTALVGLSMMFVLGLNNFAQPRIVVAYQQHGTKAMIRAVLQTTACFAFFLGGVAALLLLFGDDLLGLIYGSAYIGYGKISAMLSLGMLAVSVSIAFQNGLVALGKPHGFLLGELSFFVTAVGLAAILIPRWELMGAATALVAASIMVSVVTISTLAWILRQDSSSDATEQSQAVSNG